MYSPTSDSANVRTRVPRYDVIVIGGGILGMSTAWQMRNRRPDLSILLLEKEAGPALHQTGRNSGVIHAGVYYAPGSLKAHYCRQGNAATKEFCRENDIPFEQCGKLIVATDEPELERMQALAGRCTENGIEIEVLDQARLSQREPSITGAGALFVPPTGIVDFARVATRMGELFEKAGGEVRFGTQVVSVQESSERVAVTTTDGNFEARYLVACTGLQADRLATMIGLKPDFRIVPFRGEYFRLHERHNEIVRHLIYPVPDPALPFLGVHLTRMIDGSVTVGPNAVLAFKREGYRKSDFSFSDTLAALAYPGTIKVLARHFKAGLSELRDSISRKGYLQRVQKYCPSLRVEDLLDYPAGVRAQVISRSGEIVDDFLFMNTDRSLVVCNAPSPAATSAIPIGAHVVEKLHGLMAD